jgi:hypothetical protein
MIKNFIALILFVLNSGIAQANLPDCYFRDYLTLINMVNTGAIITPPVLVNYTQASIKKCGEQKYKMTAEETVDLLENCIQATKKPEIISSCICVARKTLTITEELTKPDADAIIKSCTPK